jgi:hypothetical protein
MVMNHRTHKFGDNGGADLPKRRDLYGRGGMTQVKIVRSIDGYHLIYTEEWRKMLVTPQE